MFNYCNDYRIPATNLKSDNNNKPINPSEYYDITDERYFIPNHVQKVSLSDLLDHRCINISCGSLQYSCEAQEYYETHVRNEFIINTTDHCFHSTTFEQIKSESCYIHRDFGLSPEALVCLVQILGSLEGLENHSYVRICPELIFSLSFDLRDELIALEPEQMHHIARVWQQEVLNRYVVEEPENVWEFYYGWITNYDCSHYTLEYFTELLLNIHELLRCCEEDETLLIGIDY